MSTITRRGPRIGALAVTADDITLGTITKVSRGYAYTESGTRVSLDSYLNTWAVI
jgi:hypothetical protein